MKRILGLVAAIAVSVAMVSPMFVMSAHLEAERVDAQRNVRSAMIDTEWMKVCDQESASDADMYDLGGKMAGHND